MSVALRRAVTGSRRRNVCPGNLQTAINNTSVGGTLDVTGCTFNEKVTINKSMTLVGGNDRRNRASGSVARRRDTHYRVERHSPRHPCPQLRRSRNRCVGGQRFDRRLRIRQQHTRRFRLRRELCHVLRCRFHHNNAARTVEPGWESGGGKCHGINIVFDGCESNNNGGPGIWFDQWYPGPPYPPDRIFNPGAIVRNCRVHDNDEAGILYEVSDGAGSGFTKAEITDNVVWSNGAPWNGWFWSAGILVASSRNVEVARNIASHNLDGISALSQNREDMAGPPVGINMHDNYIVQTTDRVDDDTDKCIIAFTHDWASGIDSPASNNTGSNNHFWSVYAEPRWARFVWGNSVIQTLSSWNATAGGGGNSSYMTTQEKDTLLASVGLGFLP